MNMFSNPVDTAERPGSVGGYDQTKITGQPRWQSGARDRIARALIERTPFVALVSGAPGMLGSPLVEEIAAELPYKHHVAATDAAAEQLTLSALLERILGRQPGSFDGNKESAFDSLLQGAAGGVRRVLVVDNADQAPQEVLAHLALLTTLLGTRVPILQIVLAGGPDFLDHCSPEIARRIDPKAMIEWGPGRTRHAESPPPPPPEAPAFATPIPAPPMARQAEAELEALMTPYESDSVYAPFTVPPPPPRQHRRVWPLIAAVGCVALIGGAGEIAAYRSQTTTALHPPADRTDTPNPAEVVIPGVEPAKAEPSTAAPPPASPVPAERQATTPAAIGEPPTTPPGPPAPPAAVRLPALKAENPPLPASEAGADAPPAAALKALIHRGDLHLAQDDILAARLFYERAAPFSAEAATAAGKTYDPLVLPQVARGAQPDRDAAIGWYKRAQDMGDPAAAGLLARLQAQPPG